MDEVSQRKELAYRCLVDAAKYAPIERLCLSPQCGFAATEEGNVLGEEQQWADTTPE